jgi:hypothetical protein
MAIVTKRYVRKPLFVDAVRVSQENFDEIAQWCQGNIRTNGSESEEGSYPGARYIHVRVHNPRSPRQTKAFVGDWILYTPMGYKVYTHKAFEGSFDQEDDGSS